MCQKFAWVVTLASICALVQSLLWIGFGLASALAYLCVIPVAPYEDESDFFRVTFVKLYFEGPQCIPDGSYLGKFNEDYRKVISLFTPDKVFAVITAYVCFNAVYCILSIMLYMNRKNQANRSLLLGWSGLTLALCGLDVVLTYEVILDFLTLKDYMPTNNPELTDVYTSSAKGTTGEIPYISLVLAVVSSRFVALWLWNFFIGVTLFLDALCFRKVIKALPEDDIKKRIKQNEVVKELQQRTQDRSTSADLLNPASLFDVRNDSEYFLPKRSEEAMTDFFNIPDTSSLHKEEGSRIWEYADKGARQPFKSHSSKDCGTTNEGFASDELEPVEVDKILDFDFDSEETKITILKPAIGKPVSVPVPPPLPISGSCSC